MQQTILALMALLIAMLISFSQLNSRTQSYTRLVDDELEVMGSGVARRVLEVANTLSFDQRTTPSEWTTNGPPASVLDFDIKANFGNAPVCDLDEPFNNATGCDDLDDIHMAPNTWQEILFLYPDGDTLYFEANVQVDYVEDTDLDLPLVGTNRSYYKRVLVRLRSGIHVGQNRYTNGFVQLSRVFSYDQILEQNRALASP